MTDDRIVPGERVFVSDVSLEHAVENHHQEYKFYYVGSTRDGSRHAVEGETGAISSWKYIVPQPKKKKYWKTMAMMVRELESRGYRLNPILLEFYALTPCFYFHARHLTNAGMKATESDLASFPGFFFEEDFERDGDGDK